MSKKEIQTLRRPFLKELFRNNKFNLTMTVIAALFGAAALRKFKGGHAGPGRRGRGERAGRSGYVARRERRSVGNQHRAFA